MIVLDAAIRLSTWVKIYFQKKFWNQSSNFLEEIYISGIELRWSLGLVFPFQKSIFGFGYEAWLIPSGAI